MHYIYNSTIDIDVDNVMWSVKARAVEAVVHRLKTDLHNCVGYIQDPKLLKDSIKAIYHKHVHEDTVNDKLHRESKKTRHQTLGHNFTNYYPILKLFSLADSVVNLQ